MAATTGPREVGHSVSTGSNYLNRYVTGQYHNLQREVTDEATLTEGNLDSGDRGAWMAASVDVFFLGVLEYHRLYIP